MGRRATSQFAGLCVWKGGGGGGKKRGVWLQGCVLRSDDEMDYWEPLREHLPLLFPRDSKALLVQLERMAPLDLR